MGGPRFVQLEPVGQCDLRCQMCPSRFRRDGAPWGPPAFMTWDLFTRLLREFAGARRLHLQGLGEPLLHPRLFEMVSYAVKLGFRVSVGTNATRIGKRRAASLVSCGLDVLNVSVDGATRETYEAIRTRGRFRRLLRGLLLLRRAKERSGSGRPVVRFVTVAMKENLPELPAIVRLAHRLGVPTVSVQHLAHTFMDSTLPEQYAAMRDYVRAETLVDEDGPRVEAYFKRARQAARECGVALRLPALPLEPRPADGRPRCTWPSEGAYVTYRGVALPCAVAGTPDRIALGDVTRDGFGRVWAGPAYRVFRAALASGNPPEICRHCSVYNGTF